MALVVVSYLPDPALVWGEEGRSRNARRNGRERVGRSDGGAGAPEESVAYGRASEGESETNSIPVQYWPA